MVTAAHPGFAVTNLQTSGPGGGFSPLAVAMAVLKPVLSQDAHHGALPTLSAAVAPHAAGGGYYGPDGPFEMKGLPKPVPIAAAAKKQHDAERLWSEAERLTGTAFVL